MAEADVLGMGFIGALMGFYLIIAAAMYVYFGFVFMTLAKKLKYDKPWLAWIPVANMFLYPILAGKTWPWGFLLFVPLANVVFIIMWLWKIYEKRKYPGALSLVGLGMIIPFLGILAGIAHFVIMGVVAWVDRK